MQPNTSDTPVSERRPVPFWVQLIVLIGLLGLLAVLALGLQRTRHAVLNEGAPVPNFTLALYPGYEYMGASQVSLSELRGRVVVVNFWASWCKPCEGEADDLQEAWHRYQETGEVVILGVDYVDTEAEARAYLAKFSITYPNGPDLGTRVSQLFNRSLGVPETYIIDSQGILRHAWIGPFESAADLEALIDPLLGEK